MNGIDFKEFFIKYTVIAEFFRRNKKALLQFCECWKCKYLYLYGEDRIPYGKCTHPKRPMMKVPCGLKKKKWDGEKYGIKVPKLKE